MPELFLESVFGLVKFHSQPSAGTELILQRHADKAHLLYKVVNTTAYSNHIVGVRHCHFLLLCCDHAEFLPY